MKNAGRKLVNNTIAASSNEQRQHKVTNLGFNSESYVQSILTSEKGSISFDTTGQVNPYQKIPKP
jgi:hypothetical protein